MAAIIGILVSKLDKYETETRTEDVHDAAHYMPAGLVHTSLVRCCQWGFPRLR